MSTVNWVVLMVWQWKGLGGLMAQQMCNKLCVSKSETNPG